VTFPAAFDYIVGVARVSVTGKVAAASLVAGCIAQPETNGSHAFALILPAFLHCCRN
jgi:hypothetical protein